MAGRSSEATLYWMPERFALLGIFRITKRNQLALGSHQHSASATCRLT